MYLYHGFALKRVALKWNNHNVMVWGELLIGEGKKAYLESPDFDPCSLLLGSELVLLFLQLLRHPEMVDLCPGDALYWDCHPTRKDIATMRLIQ